MTSSRGDATPPVAARSTLVTVVVADDNDRFRTGMVRALQRWSGTEVVGTARDGAEALEAARRLRPQVLVVDDRMPLMDGFEVARAVTSDPALAGVRVVMLSGSSGEEQVAAAAAAGAVARIDKHETRSQICSAIELAGAAPDLPVEEDPDDLGRPMTAGSEQDDARVWLAVSRERTRLADALHDGPLQDVITITQDLADAVAGDVDAHEALAAAAEDLDRVRVALRAIGGALQEASLAEVTLANAVGQVSRALELDGRLEVALDVPAEVDGFVDPFVRETVRELLINVVRHAEATMVAVSITLVGSDLQIRVADNGRGFDPAAAKIAREAGHLGLQRLERGVARLGGRVRMTAAVPVGTIATVSLPASGLEHRGDRPGVPDRTGSADREGQSTSMIMAAAAERDGVARADDLLALARDRAADARDVLSARAEPDRRPGDGPSEAPGQRDPGPARESRANALDDRDRAAGDRERGAVERLLAAADRLALAAQLTIAETDALTGARTRTAGLEDLRREIDRNRRTDSLLLVAYVDVNGLKAVNDALGHGAGDELLQRVTGMLRGWLRSYDLIIRLGGDEFLCVMPGLSKSGAEKRFAGVSAALAEAPSAAISVGFARLNRQDTASALIGRADRDLMLRRRAGGRPGGSGPAEG